MLPTGRLVFTDTHNSDTPEFLFGGKYIILRRLGQGAYGEVFLTRHAGLNVHRAVKRIRKSRDGFRTGRNEADILKNLSYPSLPIIYDIGEDDVYFYIVEEYIEGESLTDYVAKRGRLTEKEASAFAMSICTVLDYMQKNGGICHLDLKPDNIIVTGQGIKLLDFGSSLLAGRIPDYVTGTKGYAAPEMYRKGRLDGSCDIYAVGMLLGYMISGQAFFKTKRPQIHCSENLKFIIYKCISYEKEERYGSAAELFSALEHSQIQNEAASNPTVINIFGSGCRVGTTHLAVMLAAHFTATNRKCLLVLADRTKRAAAGLPFYETVKHITYARGLYIVDGVRIMPDYGGCALPMEEDELADFHVIIKDCGYIDGRKMKQEQAFPETGHTILVSGHTASELSEFERAADCLDEAGKDYIVAVNFTDGKGFSGIRKEHNMKRAFRIPYCVNPFSYVERSGFLEKTIVQEAVPGRIKAGMRHRRGRSRKRLRSNAFYLVCRQLSVKRKRKQGGGL